MAQDAENVDATLEQLLQGVLEAHPDRVAAWLRDEPGEWGFLSGQAVLAVRRLLGRSLEYTERRWVWHQMWQVLQEHKRQQQGGAYDAFRPG
jgi:hypothetical protein